MTVFDAVAFIVLVTMMASVIRAWIKHRAGGGSSAMTAEQAARLVKLEERVKALESVVSDSSYELKQKLKELER